MTSTDQALKRHRQAGAPTSRPSRDLPDRIVAQKMPPVPVLPERNDAPPPRWQTGRPRQRPFTSGRERPQARTSAQGSPIRRSAPVLAVTKYRRSAALRPCSTGTIPWTRWRFSCRGRAGICVWVWWRSHSPPSCFARSYRLATCSVRRRRETAAIWLFNYVTRMKQSPLRSISTPEKLFPSQI